MESVIGLRFPTLPSPSVRMPSGFHAARATKPHLRLVSHSSLSLAKDPRSLSLGHNSSLSLPQSSGGRPLDHIIGPISCRVDGSLPPTHNRDHRGAANVPWASPFLRNVGWGNRSNHKANVCPEGELPSSPPSGDDEEDQGEQLQYLVKRLQQSQYNDLAAKLQKALEPTVKEKNAYDEIMGIVRVLQDRQNYNLAVELLKAFEPYVKEPDSVASIKSKIMEILYDQIIDMVKVLKDFQNYNLAVELLKAFEPYVKEQDPLSHIKFSIMEILCNQVENKEASKYWIQLYEMKDSQQLRKLSSPEMQSCILCGLSQHEKAIEYIQKFIEFQIESNPIPSAPPGDESSNDRGT